LARNLTVLAETASSAALYVQTIITNVAGRLPMPDRPLLALPAPPASPLEVAPVSVARAGGLLDIAAVVRNPTDAPHPLPPVEILLVDRGGAMVDRQRLRLSPAPLGPGERREIVLAAVDPKGQATGVALRLRPAGPGRP
ncbi:MAG: hypothetical protein ACK4TG_07950, partial [Thermaurantiacus sp.]